jgi:hypothetical protein
MSLAEAPRVEVLPDPERSPVTLDGPLDSVQSAVISMASAEIEELWRPERLERLARSYWRHLNRISLRALRVEYGEHSRSVMLFRKIELLRFREPRYESGEDFGRVTWPIEKGVLVARRGRDQGELAIEIERAEDPGSATVSARVSNFYPWLRGSGFLAQLGRFIYAQTQLRIHVFVTKRFLRSLARLDLSA